MKWNYNLRWMILLRGDPWGSRARCFEGLLAARRGDMTAGLPPMRRELDNAGDARFLPRFSLLTMGLTGKMLTNHVGDGRLTKFGVRFTNQVWPGDDLDAKATVAAVREEGGKHYVDLTLSTTNQDGKEVASGSATALVDP